MTKYHLLEFLRAHKLELQQTFSLTKIGLFGSYAKGTADESSDVDIAIESEKRDFFLREDLKEYLQQNLELPVDVGYIDSFRSYYREKIEKEIIYV